MSNFLIFDESESEIDLEVKVEDFIIQKFGELILDKVSIEVYVTEEDLGTPDYKEYLNIYLKFNEFTYDNRAYGEQIESVGIILENKGLQPFYIDGKFVSLNVYEWIQGMLIQKTNMIYGFGKDQIYNEFADFMLTC